MAARGGDTRGLLQEAFRAALGSWAVLQIAVDNGFGGAHSQEKAEWMVGALEQHFLANADLEQYEVEDFLSELMNNEFDTLVEDGSLPEVAQQVCTFHRQCQRGETGAVRERIAQLCQKKQQVKVNIVQGQSSSQNEEEEEEGEEEEEEETMDCDGTASTTASSRPDAQPKVDTTAAGMDDEEAADGWTIVCKKKK